MDTSRDTSGQDDESLKRVAFARLETGELSVTGLTAVGLSFGVEAHFLLDARKKSLLQDPWLHFLEVSHSSGRGFPAGFRRGAHCSAGNLVLQLRGPRLRMWPWWRRR
ncbi:MAG: hypothetical protein DMG76_21190 [Acidobacteria bacterium]|nr:MAG: hypothetical protein DMG76_21190 [Acidobacteriota bacterium]